MCRVGPWLIHISLTLSPSFRCVTLFLNAAPGGVISLLSLNGLFLLMQEYNLEYPEFYPRLYALLKPNVFHAKYRQRFFRLLDLFLSSRYRSWCLFEIAIFFLFFFLLFSYIYNGLCCQFVQ